MDAPAISLRSVVCLRAAQPVLRGLSLDVTAGEALLVTGANGTGKTTLLRLVAGLLPLSAGTGVVLGHDLQRERARIRQSVTLVAHDSFGYDELSVRHNLQFHARLVGHGNRVSDVLERLGLSRVADQPHALLSAGQRRRTALGIALLQNRPLLLLDEPHAALDAEGRELVNTEIRAATARGATVVVVTHEADLVRPFVHREIALQDGRIGITATV